MKDKRNAFSRLTAREKNIAYVAFSVIVLCAGIKFGVVPLVDRFRLLKKELVVAGLNLNEYRHLFVEEKQLKDFYAGLPLSEKTGGESGDILALTLKQLEGLSQEAGLRIDDIRPLDTVKKGESRELVIELKAEGTIAAIAKFLYNMEYSSQFIAVEKMDINYKTQNILEAGIVISRPVAR